MALKVKAKEKKMKFFKDGPEVYRYVMVPDLYSTLDQSKVIKEAAIRSGVSEGVMQAYWKGAGEVIKAWATEGHSVASTAIQITCYDRNGEIVKRVTSADPGTVEETDNTDDNGEGTTTPTTPDSGDGPTNDSGDGPTNEP